MYNSYDDLDLSSVPNISNLSELNNYLAKLQNRIQTLELENKTQRNALQELENQNHDIIAVLRQRHPKSMLFNESFLIRAMAVWGHYTAFQSIIFPFVFIFALILFMAGLLHFPVQP